MNQKIVIVTRKTRLEELVEQYNTVDQAKFYLETMGQDFALYAEENGRYGASLSAVEEAVIELNYRYIILERRFLSNFLFSPDDIVIVLGQDGLVANTLKYLEGQGVIGVNPDVLSWDGILLPFQPEDVKKIIKEYINGKRKYKEITMAEAVLNDGQTILAVNDFFIGPASHTSFRYQLEYNGRVEHQSSSGIIVSAPLGGSAWLKSILTGARQIISSFGKTPEIRSPFSGWSDKKLIYSVREPFPTITTESTLCFGELKQGRQLTIHSNTPENGVIFSDGIESDYLQFNSGTTATIGVSARRGCLVI